MKQVLILLIVIICSPSFSQSKKEQIEALNFSLDSLTKKNQEIKIAYNDSLSIERFHAIEYKNEITIQKKEIDFLTQQSKSFQQKINELHSESEAIKTNYEKLIGELNNQLSTYKSVKSLSNCIVIKSKQPIQGYELEILFYPRQIAGYDTILYNGYCVINFINEENIFTFLIHSYNLSKSLFSSVKGIEFDSTFGEIIKCPFQEIEVDNQ